MSVQLKTPEADFIYTFEWEDEIPAGVTLSTVEHTVPSPLVREFQQTDSGLKMSTVRISGGVHGRTYQIEALATLSNGEDVPGLMTLRVSNA